MRTLTGAACLAALAFCGCLNRQAVQEPGKAPVAEQPQREPFPERPAASPAAPVETAAAEAGAPARDFTGSRGPVTEAWGWRVQIFASATPENARRVAEEARWKFGDQQVFIVEALPYYKVQVGSSLAKQDADRMKTRARSLGFEQAWVVEVDLTR